MFAFACCQGYHFTWHCLSHPSTVQPQWISECLSKEQPLTLVGSKKCSGTGSCFLKASSQVWCILGCAFCMLFGSYCASSWEVAGILNATLPILCFGCTLWTGRSSIAAVSHEERHAAHIELLSELKNSTGSGGQQEGCIVGSWSAVVHSLPAALERFQTRMSGHSHLCLQVALSLRSHVCYSALDAQLCHLRSEVWQNCSPCIHLMWMWFQDLRL
jgi:hypothetical protein